ncbi:16S rRNA (cytidine(1402)-2'-O)-methyltransferase [Xylocopilactobacillus apis]|uniref:Ribosomal RNA small subunit methyltransferase I n=1 Tax=Xylocopilactobacillus apis TaxID=2932183 RepID=A0AAU9D7A5_9LACO|nr:16S rRNA (cytidine(1402)-2'-O)-methyltransferase [Xylocopilactobacillus apis]BDR56657.1 ribosomal RNA small subunit methyltransferase I [Xylocopilactobacillus apis]
MNQRNDEKIGTLFLIPTPIGNLGDLTLRSLDTLKEVDLLLCEDTRHTQILLEHYQIKTPKLSFHEHNSKQRIPEVVDKLKSGLNLGLVSDAGMPVISDPGVDLVSTLRKQKIPVFALPGANAATTALVGSGFPAIPYTFLGFLPRNAKEIKETLDHIYDQTIIFYESPYRLLKTVKVIETIDPIWQLCTARELTKIHEEYFAGSADEVLRHYEEFPPKGEFVVLLAPRTKKLTVPAKDQWVEIIKHEIDNGISPNTAIKNFAKKYQLERKIVYDVYHMIKQ